MKKFCFLIIINTVLVGTLSIFSKILKVIKKVNWEDIIAYNKLLERSEAYYKLIYEWFSKKNNGKFIHLYFKKNNIKKIAIYGNGSLASLLLQELKESNIEIVCFIDQFSSNMLQTDGAIPIINIRELVNSNIDIDAIIITPIHAYTSILQSLDKEKLKCRIIALDEIIYTGM